MKLQIGYLCAKGKDTHITEFTFATSQPNDQTKKIEGEQDPSKKREGLFISKKALVGPVASR
jgi:hypothetical protein